MRLTILQRGTFNPGDWELDYKTGRLISGRVIRNGETNPDIIEAILSEGPKIAITSSDGFLYVRPNFSIEDTEGMSLIGYPYTGEELGKAVFLPKPGDLSTSLVFYETQREELILRARLDRPATFYTLEMNQGMRLVNEAEIKGRGSFNSLCLALDLRPNIVGIEKRGRYIGDFVFEGTNLPILIFPSGSSKDWPLIYPIAIMDFLIRNLSLGRFDENDPILRRKMAALLWELQLRRDTLTEVLTRNFGLNEKQLCMLEGHIKTALEVPGEFFDTREPYTMKGRANFGVGFCENKG